MAEIIITTTSREDLGAKRAAEEYNRDNKTTLTTVQFVRMRISRLLNEYADRYTELDMRQRAEKARLASETDLAAIDAILSKY